MPAHQLSAKNPIPPLGSELATLSASLTAIVQFFGLVACALVVGLLLTDAKPSGVLVAAMFALFSGGCLWLIRLGRVHMAALVLIAAAILTAVVGITEVGSVRAAVGFMFVGAVATAGVFLGRKTQVATVIACVGAIGLLTWIESQGGLTQGPSYVGWNTWLVHSATLIAVARMIYVGRSREQRVMQLLTSELEQRRSLERERDLSLDRFARIFRNSPSPMLAQSARTGSILDVNPSFERTFDYKRTDVLGQSDQFLWADAEQRQTYLDILVATRRVHQFQCKAVHANGTSICLLVSSELGSDRDDPLIITTLTDVSEQALALERLQRSEDRFSKAFHFSPLNMAITRISDDLILEVNQSSQPVQGYNPNELNNRSALDTGFWLTAEDRHAFVDRLARDGHIHALEGQMRHREGHLINTRMWAEQIELDGEACILSCSVSIDDEKQREALLLDIAKGMSTTTAQAFYQTLTHHMALVLKADTVMLGELRDGQWAESLSVFQDGVHLPHAAPDLIDGPCVQTLELDGPYLVERHLAESFPESATIRRHGYQAYIGQSLRDEFHRPIGLLIAAWKRPITPQPELFALLAIYASRANAELLRLQRDREIRRLNENQEERVRQRTADLQRLNAELDSFAYSVSHDLRTPLRSIDGFTQLLGEQLQGRLSTEESRLFVRILTATQRMSLLITDLLALARVSQGPLERSPFNLSLLAEQFLRNAQNKHPERGVRWEVSPGLQERCDPRLTGMALESLLDNALKYTLDQAGPQIKFGQLPALGAEPGSFFISDNGVGFEMAHSDLLFKPFQRLHPPSAFEGTGIGLATARRIAERHGGFIMGYGQVGLGAVFAFAFNRRSRRPSIEELASLLPGAQPLA